MVDHLIPIVPFETYEAYETSVAELIHDYSAMVERTIMDGGDDVGVSIGNFYRVRWTVRARWLDGGLGLFLKMTGGLGKDWCHAMNTMVVHSLEIAFRIFAEFCDNDGNARVPSIPLARLLKREVGIAIANRSVTPNNLCRFEELNFQFVHLSPPGWMFDPEIQGEHLPIGQVQAMKLAFAMAMHARLGAASGARVLWNDNVKMILSDEIFL